MNTPDWLSLEQLSDAGDLRALYPYPLLENIPFPGHCRKAASNETAAFEQEFGLDIVQPFYRLLWRLNTISDIFTSHSTVSPPDRKSPFGWAEAFVGASTVIMPRDQIARHDLRAASGMATMLARILAQSRFIPKETTGWQIRVFPTIVNLAYETGIGSPEGRILLRHGMEQHEGFAHELVITGSAGTHRRAAERWERATDFICETLAHLPEFPPYTHYEIVDGERRLPGTTS
jgi:hypothetical protein